ncbi:MAG: galactitol-1-phosphate 5-dehydrogenase [Lachnospiraceae bacterium]|nr:galactitol-1-phosphate 5-dehydrogenase [Lachnospiraceae bacterium]
MKVANLHGINDLRYEDIPVPKCEADEVLIEIKSCGICGSDVPRVYTKGTYHFPTVIGHEFAGKVVEDAKGELVGARVAVFPLLPCFSCDSCKDENYASCKDYDYYGSRRDGGMAEYIAVKRWNLVPLPENISYDEGAMCEPISVSRHAVLKLKIEKGDHVLISGAGPIGLIAGQWAKAFGADEVYYFDIDERKIAFAKTMGFKEYDPTCEINKVIEGTGYGDALKKCLEAVKPYGTVVLMGNPAREVVLSQNTYWHIMRKELTVLGTWNSSYSEKQNDWEESIKALAEGRLNVKPLITHKIPLSQCNEAFEVLKNRTEFCNKVILNMNTEEV